MERIFCLFILLFLSIKAINAQTAYVANNDDNTVTPVNIATNIPGTPIAVGINPRGIAITPDGTTVYVANVFDDTVTPIDIATSIPGAPITVGNGPRNIAITPFVESSAVCIEDNYLTQTDLVNVITWNALSVASSRFLIFRDASLSTLVDVVPGSRLSYEDHQRVPGSVNNYFIVAENAQGNRALIGSTVVRSP